MEVEIVMAEGEITYPPISIPVVDFLFPITGVPGDSNVAEQNGGVIPSPSPDPTLNNLVAHLSRSTCTIQLVDGDVIAFFTDRARIDMSTMTLKEGDSQVDYDSQKFTVNEGERALFYCRISNGGVASSVRWVPMTAGSDLEGEDIFPMHEVQLSSAEYNKESGLITLYYWAGIPHEAEPTVEGEEEDEFIGIRENEFDIQRYIASRILYYSVGSLIWKKIDGGTYSSEEAKENLIPIFTAPVVLADMYIENKSYTPPPS